MPGVEEIMVKWWFGIFVLLAVAVDGAEAAGSPMSRVERFVKSSYRRAEQAWATRRRIGQLERVAKASSDAWEFRRLYPKAKIEPWFSYDGSAEYFAKYDQLLLSAGLYERYILMLYVPFRRGTTVGEKATFRLTEIARVDINPTNGQATIHYGYQTSAPAERHVWECLRWSRDLRAFGVMTVTNGPVAGFERAWRR
jgi:hypothetical protein